VTTDRDVSLRADARPRVHADRAYYFRGGEVLEWTGLGSRLLFDVDPDVVVDARTDGETLVWLRAPSWDLEPGQLWRAPLQGGLPVDPVPFAVAPPVAPAPAFHRIGGGYYAVIEGSASSIPDHPTRLHLYRLADGRHWIVPDQPDQYTVETGAPPRAPGLRTTAAGIVHLDETEIWWVGASQSYTYAISHFRQRLDSLGPGE